MCFSDRQAGDWGPRRVGEAELRAAFGTDWSIASLTPERFDAGLRGLRLWPALLGSLCRDAELHADPLPGDPGAASGVRGVADLALTSGPGQRCSTEQMLGDGDLIVRGRLVVLEALGELVGVVEDVLDGTGHGGHLMNFSRAGIAWTMGSIAINIY